MIAVIKTSTTQSSPSVCYYCISNLIQQIKLSIPHIFDVSGHILLSNLT